jgi:hypothetical protein
MNMNEVMETRVKFIGRWESDACKKKHVFEQ